MTVQVSPEIQGRLSEMYGKLIYKYCIYKKKCSQYFQKTFDHFMFYCSKVSQKLKKKMN